MKKQPIIIEVGRLGILQKIPVVQEDSGRVLSCIMADMELKDTYKARIYAVKPSKEEIYNDCVINGNTIEVELTDQMLAEVGYTACQIRTTNTSAKVVTSFEFILDVKKSLMSESAIESSSEYKALDKALSDITGTVAKETQEYLENNNITGAKVYYVTISKQGDKYVSDRTAAEVEAAYQGGYIISCIVPFGLDTCIIPLISRTEGIAWTFEGLVYNERVNVVLLGSAVTFTQEELASGGGSVTETDPTVPDWAKQPQKPSYTASEVGADESGTAENKVSAHNAATDSHNDIRLLIQNVQNALEAFLDIDDESMNQATEFVAYMKDNRELIEQITTSKVSVSDIVDDYVTNVSDKPVSAAVAVKLKALIDAIIVPTKTSQLVNDSGFLTQHQDLSGYAKKATTLAGYGITDGVTKEEFEQLSVPSVTIDTSTKTLNISSGGITSETINEISDYVSKYEVEKIVLDGVELEFTGYASKEEVADKMSRPIIATIGQVIAVKAVDENGKPTEFMAVDQQEASGGGSSEGTETYEIVVKCAPTASDGVDAYPLTDNYIDCSGATVNYATGYYVSRAYPIVDGCIVEYKGAGVTAHKIVAFYDENGAFISGISPTASGISMIEGIADIPDGAKIVRFGTNGTDAYGKITYVASGEITVSSAAYGISGSAWENVLSKTGYYDRTGTFAATNSYVSSDYIEVNAQYIAITLYAKTYTTIGSICFFDSKERFISCTPFAQNTSRHSEVFLVPSDAKYYTLTIDESASSVVCVECVAIASSSSDSGSSGGDSNGTAILVTELTERVKGIEEHIEVVEAQTEELYSETIKSDYTTIVNNSVANAYMSATDGTEAATNNFKASDFVEIDSSCIIDYSLYGSTSVAMIAYYDKHKDFISGIVPISSGIHSDSGVVPPEDAFYIRYAVIISSSGYEGQYVNITRRRVDSLFISNERAKNGNPLYGKILTATGDSITATVSNRPYASYARMIAADNNMAYETKAIWGATIASGVDDSSGCILDTLSSMRTDADYIILSGGANDLYYLSSGNEQLGSITSGYAATLDITTFCGALESMCKTAIEKWVGKKILYVITHRMLDVSEQTSSQGVSILKQILEKWGISYVDLWHDMPSLMLPSLKNLYTSNGNTVYAGVGDGLHPNEDGYRLYYVPRVEAKLRSI